MQPIRIFASEYKEWLNEIKQRFQSSQIKASMQVNSTLLEFYWNLGSEIVEKQKNSTWGSGFLEQLSNDLSAEFPDVKGFSKRNLELIRKWYLFWQQVVGELMQIPWGHNIAIIQKCKTTDEALYYVQNTIKNGAIIRREFKGGG